MTNKIVFTLQVDFAMPEATVMNLFAIASSELFGCFVAGSSEIREKIRICRECKDYVIGREITTTPLN